ncbi:Hypothetical protein SSCIU_01480 [Mammaliicoccus sciuri]|nr:Hypothetical protein SSCIU_01480 [Mammaliicoccus sciuri]
MHYAFVLFFLDDFVKF